MREAEIIAWLEKMEEDFAEELQRATEAQDICNRGLDATQSVLRLIQKGEGAAANKYQIGDVVTVLVGAIPTKVTIKAIRHKTIYDVAVRPRVLLQIEEDDIEGKFEEEGNLGANNAGTDNNH